MFMAHLQKGHELEIEWSLLSLPGKEAYDVAYGPDMGFANTTIQLDDYPFYLDQAQTVEVKARKASLK